MDRRHFVKQSSLISVGGLLISPKLVSKFSKLTAFEDLKYDGKVLVIGAGAAGLYAGYMLQSKGIDFQILEAAPHYGGRVGKLTGFADYPLDLGAQWLHGKNNIMGRLVAKTKTSITLDDSDEYYWFNNKIVKSLPRDIEAIFLQEDDLPDISFRDFATKEGFGNEYANIVEGIAGDSGAAARRISTYWKIREEENWVSGDDDYKFEQTYFDLIDTQIAAAIKNKIKLNTIVSKIDYSQNSIIVTDSNRNTFSGDKVIVTVPITILKSKSIEFIPALSREKTTAFSKIGMDAGMKVFLKFRSGFYKGNITGGSICASYSDEIVGKTGSDNVLLAFIMGDQAEYLNSLGSDRAITNALLKELDIMYGGQATASFIDAHVINWTTNPFIRGAYSYSTIGIGNARQIAAQPVAEKLYFAGEAMNINGNHQTVFGAAETGYQEVNNILKSVKK